MNQTQRLALVMEALRIANVAQRGHSKLEDNVRSNKEAIDAVLRHIALTAIPRNKLRQRPKRWSDLRPQDRERIVNKLARKCLRRGLSYYSGAYNSFLTEAYHRMGLVGPVDELLTKVEERMRQLGHLQFNRHRLSFWNAKREQRIVKEGTPTSRLDELRRSLINGWRFDASAGYRNPVNLLEFCSYIHPDDVEWQRYEGDPDVDGADHAYRVVCSREVIKLSKLFPGTKPLAANLYLEDEKTSSRVYYAAFLEMPSRNCPYVRQSYIAIARLPHQGTTKTDYTTTTFYKTPAGALKAANGIYGHHMAQFLYKEAAQ